MELDRNLRIGIVGLGLMGGSYAQALSAKGFEVGAIDQREESIEFALERSWIAHGKCEPDPAYIGGFDIVVFALYPRTFVEWIEANQSHLKPGALITDVTGIKGCVVYRIQDMLRDDIEYIAAHPMAGRESSGIEFADGSIFDDANYIVTPTEANTEKAIAMCKALGETLGFKRIVELTPEKHDEMIAFLSQLTHCIAVSLMTCRDTTSLAEFTGDSFRDLTRIAKINDRMWSELFELNKEQLLAQMDLFSSAFSELREHIANDETDEIRKIMRLSTSNREAFDKTEA